MLFSIFRMMFRYFQILFLALLGSFFLVACSDDTEGVEYMFDREVSEMSVLRQCAKDADSGAYCFQIRFRYPIETENLESFYLWVDSTVVGDTAKGVSKSQLEKATAVFDYSDAPAGLFDTIDLTEYIQEFVKTRDSLMVAIYCGYSDDKDPGSVQRTFLHFGDDLAPSAVSVRDSVWTTGALFEWFRPTDQRDYYQPADIYGPIVGYNIVIYSEDKDEDLRELKATVISADGTDSTGKTLYRRYARIISNNDSVWVDSINQSEKNKNYFHVTILDGKGVDSTDNEKNRFRLIIEGLKAESRYTIGLSAFDSAGNSSGTNGVSSVTTNQLFITTDSIAPLMPTSIFTIKDSLYPELARLDSNNRLRIFWSRSVDPLMVKHDIKVDSVLLIPDACYEGFCYDSIPTSYVIDYYDQIAGQWVTYSYAGGDAERYTELYEISGDTMAVYVPPVDGSKRDSLNVLPFVTDTIRWVAPGDTLIIRIRSKDKSGYYSTALVDTIAVSPGELASQVECPEGFVPVSIGDTTIFCMERFEHKNDSGKFVSNVLHSEAMAACEAISASGFEVKLCGEQDWQLVCLSGGTLSYGVIEEDVAASEYLFSSCNVGTNDSAMALNLSLRSPRCVSPMGVRDFPGELQEWVRGRSDDTLAVVKGGSYEVFGGLDRESQALCTTRSFPYYTRPAYTKDTVYLYREGTRVDTVFTADTTRNLYEIITANHKDEKYRFKDTLQFFTVKDPSGNEIGEDYALYGEYKKGGDEWLAEISNGLTYEPSRTEVVFVKKERVAYRQAAAFYKSPSIGFRCCAYPQ